MVRAVRAALLTGMLLAPACGPPGREPAVPAPPAEPAPDVRRPVLAIGLIPEQNVFRQRERYQPLAAYLSARTGIEFQLKSLTRYGNILHNFNDAELDGAFFGSFTYCLAHRQIDVEVLARPEREDGSSTYRGFVFTRKGSGIAGARDLRGRRFVFVDRATTAGFLLPLEFLANAGVHDYRTFLGETYFAGTHEDAIDDVLAGKADAGAAKSTVYDRMVSADPTIPDRLVILARSPEVPENALALRSEIPAAVREKIRATLLDMHHDPEGRRVLDAFGARRFIPTTDADYAPVYAYAAHVGMDLSKYHYDNYR